MGDLPPVLIAHLVAVASLVVAVAAVVYAYQAIAAIRRLANADSPLGFAPVMATPVLPAPPFGEPRHQQTPPADARRPSLGE
jgi:hypothetical protein